MRNIVKHIPNFVTCLNLIAGTLAVIYAFESKLEQSCYLIGIALILDFLDGFLSRLLNAYSELGKQLDSLADLISFGLAPSVFLYQLNKLVFINDGNFSSLIKPDIITFIILGSSFLVVIFSALRLAKFNIDEEQTTSFKGLPTPANAILIASFPLIVFQYENTIYSDIILNHYFLLSIAVVSSFLLISNIPMFSLKLKSFAVKKNLIQYIFLLISLILLITLQFLAIPLIIITYILLSIIGSFINIKYD